MITFIKKYPFISAIILAVLLCFVTFLAPGILFVGAAVRVGLCAILVFFLYRWGLQGALQFRLSTFMRGLLIGMPVFLFALWIAHNNALVFPGIFKWPIESNITINVAFWSLCITVLMIGILEELIFRGLVLNTYLKHKGVTRNTIYKAVLFSSLIFGIGHYADLVYGGSFLMTSVNVYLACCMGVFLAAVYVKCMNIWLPAFLHTLWDFGGLLAFFENGSATTSVDEAVKLTFAQILSNSAQNIIESTVILCIGIFILRNIHKEKYVSAITEMLRKGAETIQNGI
jgi:membrane protease YdiL (CAAX protease family)